MRPAVKTVEIKLMKKVVVNKCFGGFSLSDKAIELLRERKMGEQVYYKGKPSGSIIDYLHCYEYREDKDLVEVVELLGEEANTGYSELVVIEIPDIKYYINDYDGYETIIEIGHSW